MTRALEKYYTQRRAVQILLAECAAARGEVLFDPTCGDGRMSRALLRSGRFLIVDLNDLDQSVRADTHLDCLAAALWAGRRCDWVITNPPFSRGGELARLALAAASGGVAFLVRLSFLEACAKSHKAPGGERRWLAQTPPTQVIVLPRMSFTENGKTDSVTCCWCIWKKNSDGSVRRGTISIVGDSEP